MWKPEICCPIYKKTSASKVDESLKIYLRALPTNYPEGVPICSTKPMKRSSQLVFFLVVLFVWTAMHAYVFQRASTVPLISGHIPSRVLFVIAVIMWGAFFVGRALSTIGLGSLLRYLIFNWIGVLFLFFACLLAIDFATGFGFLFRSFVPTLRGCALVVGVALSVVAFIQAHRAPVVRTYDVKLAGLPAEKDGSVVVLASDLHLGSFLDGDWLSARIRQIDTLHPDVIILAGDIIEGGESERHVMPTLSRLKAPWGVWAVTGNHEFYGGLEGSVRMMEEAGFHVLRDRSHEVAPGLVVAGVDDLGARRGEGSRSAFISSALGGNHNGAATIFVSHTPSGAEEAALKGAGLMVSGHTHNGQIWPFNFIVQRAFPLIGGMYNVNGMPVIVCRGTGTWGPRMRLGYPSEIVKIILHSPLKPTVQTGN